MNTDNCYLGEEGTEQFTVRATVDGELVKEQAIHDPFINTTTITSFSRWRCFLGIFKGLTVKTQVSVRGSHAAQARIMTMNPFDLQRETKEWEAARADPSTWVSSTCGEMRSRG